MADYDVTVSVNASDAESKLTDLETKIKNLEKTKPIKLNIDTKGLSSQIKNIQNQIKGLSKIPVRIGGSGTKGLTGVANTASSSYKKLLSVMNQVKSAEMKMSKMSTIGEGVTDTKRYANLQGQLRNIQKLHSGIQSHFEKNGTLNTSYGQQALRTLERRMQAFNASYTKTQGLLASSIQEKMNTGKYTADISKLEAAYGKLNTKSQEVAKSVQNVGNAYNKMNVAKQTKDMQALVKAEQEYVSAYKKANNAIKQQQGKDSIAKRTDNIKKNLDTGKYTADISKLELSFAKLGTKSQEVAKAVQNVKGAFTNMNAARQASDMTKLANAEKQYINAMSTAKNMVATQTSVEKMNNVMSQNVGLIDRFKSSFGSLATYFSGYMIISKAISGVKDMFNNVQQVDKAMTELYRITDLSDKHYEQLYSDMTDSAKEYKASLADVIEGTASWTRLGFKPDTAKGLSEITSMYQHVTDLDVGTATENLVTAYKGYQKQLLQVGKGSETKAVEHVADVYDKIGNEFAVSAADVGEGMTRTASALETSSNSFEQGVGLITAISEVTQDPAKAGNSLKTKLCLYVQKCA